jgi:Right handed beta helix region
MSHRRLFCLISILWLLLPVAACHQDNSWYCEDRAYKNCVNNPGEFPCTDKADCAGQEGKLSCSELKEETGTGVCVQCTAADAAACLGVTPICGADNSCRACGKHADCSSAACLGDGSCGSETNVAYVAANGAGAACSKTTPCATVAAALTTGKPIIKVATGLVKSSQATIIDGKAVTILAEDGAKLDRDGDGAVLEVRSAGADVKIFDLEITGATGSSGANGVDVNPNGGMPRLALSRVKLTGNQGLGLSAQGGAVTISQSTIASNVGGGISISNATFDITNSFIYRNGNSTGTTIGGVNFAVSAAGGNRFEFNTVVDNEISSSTISSGGVLCDIPGFAAPNNIIARNFVNRVATAGNANTLGQCTHPSSKVVADLAELKFLAPDMPPFSYRLGAGSSAIDQATTASTVAVDADGDVRPQGAQKDIGADEYKAN